MSPHCGSYDRGAVEMILGEKIKSSMLYINTVYYNLIIIKIHYDEMVRQHHLLNGR